jgi:uncharacterized protein (TIGR03084 family)
MSNEAGPTAAVLTALTAESEALDELVAGLPDNEWRRPTPAPGWTIAHQVTHLVSVFRLAALAAARPDRFTTLQADLRDRDFSEAVESALSEHLSLPPRRLLETWQEQRATTVRALSAVPPDSLVPWLVNPLPPAVLASAGLMETFAHGQDIADALGVRREATGRLVPIVAFAVRTRDFGYLARGLTPPEEPFRIEIESPSGDLLTFGPHDASQRVTGPALDFCLLVTRRRHRDDLRITAHGDIADQWLDIAQAYRGPAGDGRRPGQFADLASPV